MDAVEVDYDEKKKQIEQRIEKRNKKTYDFDLVEPPKLNFDRVMFHYGAIRSMDLFTNEHLQRCTVSDLPFQVDILDVYQERVYVQSSERHLSVFDMATLEKFQPDKRITATSHILSVCFCGDKIYVG